MEQKSRSDRETKRVEINIKVIKKNIVQMHNCDMKV